MIDSRTLVINLKRKLYLIVNIDNALEKNKFLKKHSALKNETKENILFWKIELLLGYFNSLRDLDLCDLAGENVP